MPNVTHLYYFCQNQFHYSDSALLLVLLACFTQLTLIHNFCRLILSQNVVAMLCVAAFLGVSRCKCVCVWHKYKGVCVCVCVTPAAFVMCLCTGVLTVERFSFLWRGRGGCQGLLHTPPPVIVCPPLLYLSLSSRGMKLTQRGILDVPGQSSFLNFMYWICPLQCPDLPPYKGQFSVYLWSFQCRHSAGLELWNARDFKSIDNILLTGQEMRSIRWSRTCGQSAGLERAVNPLVTNVRSIRWSRTIEVKILTLI